MSSPPTVVIGAGIAGLSCALRLQRAGREVRVFEAGAEVGGAMRTVSRDGFLFEAGPNTVRAEDAVVRLVEDLGLDARRVDAPTGLPRYIYWEGRMRPAPLGVSALLRSDLLSLRGKLRILAEPFAGRAPDGDESLASFVSRRLGPEVLERLVGPVVSGTFAGDPEHLSASAAFPLLGELEARYGSLAWGLLRGGARKPPGDRSSPRLLSFAGGQRELPAAIGAELGERLRLRAPVASIRRQDLHWSVELADGEALEAGAVVLAVDAGNAAELLRTLAPAAAEGLAAIAHPHMAVVSLAFARADLPRPLDGFGCLVPRGQGLRLLGSVWPSTLYPDRSPGHAVLTTNFVGGVTDPAAAELEDGEIVEIARDGLRETIGVRAEPAAVELRRYPRAIPQYEPGHALRISRVEAALQAEPGCFLAGNYLSGVSVGACIRSGEAAAERVVRFSQGDALGRVLGDD